MDNTSLIRETVRAAAQAYGTAPTDQKKAAARKVVEDPYSSATALFVAARHLLGPSFCAWEPETLWLSLPGLHDGNRDKLMAAVTLAEMPAFYWDYRVFATIIRALNDEVVIPDDVPRTTPEQLVWGVFEAELLSQLTESESFEPEYDDDPAAYCAAVLHNAGLAHAPEVLEFCAEQLAKLQTTPAAKKLAGEVREAWKMFPTLRSKLSDDDFAKSPLGVQLARLADLDTFLQHKLETLTRELAKL